MEDKLVSVVITTKNEEAVIGKLLDSLKEQSYKKIEVILVDNNSADKTVSIARLYTDRVFNEGPERSAQRNFGVSKANGEFVVILDADMILQKNVIKECVDRIHQESELGTLIIPEKSFGEGFWSRCKAFEREFYIGDETIEVARFFKKTLFDEFGGYDEKITGPEDADLPLRMKKAGVKVGRTKSFILHNERKLSLWKAAKKKFYYASHAALYLKKHPEMSFSQGNLLFRPIFLKRWRKFIGHPALGGGMLFMRSVEMTAALAGIASYFFQRGLQLLRSKIV